ncbi:MAG TPA: hypothetical protein VI636_06600 [Candidatus Angelobacter sp.]
MAVRAGLAFSSVLFFFMVLIGCGGSGGGTSGPINGPFSNSSLTGSYAFSFTGVNQFGLLAVVGSFQANGSGAITGGSVDVNSGNGIFQNQSVTGSYNVHNNGQGSATITASAGTFDIDFVIISSGHALIIRFDNNSTASGSIDLQSSSAFSLSSLAGSLVFNISGNDAGGNAEAATGVFTVDASGNVNSGVQDTNDHGLVTTNVALIPAAAAMSNPASGRGTLTITAGSTLNFVYYVVDSTHLKLLEVDLSPVLSGDAFRQTSTAISGSFAFTVGGVSTGGPFAAGGILNTDGAGNVLNTSMEDSNNGGTISQNVALSGTYSVAGNGRGTMVLNAGAINYAIYPSAGGVQALEIDPSTVASGAAFQQSGPFSNSSIQGNYGLNFTGVTSTNEIDSDAQFSADGAGHVSGAADFNDGGTLSPNLSLTGTYSIAANGRGTGTLQSSLGTQNVIFYTVSNSRVLFIDVDGGLVATGLMQHQ